MLTAQAEPPKVNEPSAKRGDGQLINPGDGVVPILKEVGYRQLAVIGTGFYLTRYGLFVTAKHVLEALAEKDGGKLVPSFVLHLASDNGIHLRQILRAHLLKAADVGIAQADNFMDSHPQNPLRNLRPTLSNELPPEGSPLITYAYPENDILDFNHDDNARVIRGNYFQGGFLRFVEQPENPSLKFPYIETTIELRHGASGGPVFDARGRIIGVNCRGWDFQGGEHEESGHLSYIAPIGLILDIDIDPFMVPSVSWEARQIPEARRGYTLKGKELAQYGHILFDPALQ
jgi:hypothetical protein